MPRFRTPLFTLSLAVTLLSSAPLLHLCAQSDTGDNIIKGAPLDYPSDQPYNPRTSPLHHNPAERLPPLRTYKPPTGWMAARAPNPAYPLLVTLNFTSRTSSENAVQGSGSVSIQGLQPAALAFRYACVLSLDPNTLYEARWVKPQRKLEILLVDRKGH